MNAMDIGKGMVKVAIHPATITIVAGGIGLATAVIGYKASKYNAEASKQQYDSIILQAKMGGFDQQVADEFLKAKVEEAVKEEMKKYRKEHEENKEDSNIAQMPVERQE